MKLLTIILNWNRPELLRKTIESYINYTTISYEMVIVDNGSRKENLSMLDELTKKYENIKVIKLKKNIGGLAFNHVLDNVNLKDYPFVHFSENDIEYLPNWDNILLDKLTTFPEIGQISPFSPFPQTEEGEFSWQKPAKKLTKENHSIYYAKNNVGTTCVVRRELLHQGLRWANIERKNGIRFPNDGRFSFQVKKLGWKVAFNDQYLVKNWGHTIEELKRDLSYYIRNHQAKSFHRFEKRIKEFGYSIQTDDAGNYYLKKD